MMQRVEYENKLASLGFKIIGSGMYARVFAIPNSDDKVIKVARNDAWPDYIKWATEHGYAGKFAPKVYSLKFKDGFYIAVMEKLATTMDYLETVSTRNEQSRMFRTYIQRSIFDPPVKKTKNTPVDLVEFMDNLMDARLANDLHASNIMVRNDGQIVVTDPTSRYFSTEKFRIKSGTLR